MEFAEWAYLTLFFSTFLAATVVPFSSEVIFTGMLAAGYDPVLSLATATAGNTIGGMTSYGIGRLANWKFIQRWLGVKEAGVMRWKKYSDKFGSYLAMLCWTPIIGDVIAVSLGIFRAKWAPVLLWMLIGKFLRYLAIMKLYEAI